MYSTGVGYKSTALLYIVGQGLHCLCIDNPASIFTK
jgi:hypothetical protein